MDLEKPDLVIGTESWLNTDHLDSEIFPRSLGYTSFRRDRASGTKGGGVFILVKDTLVASRQKTLETDCEVIWVKIEAAQSKPVYLAAYYRPNENDFHSFEEFCKSVDMVSKKMDIFGSSVTSITQSFIGMIIMSPRLSKVVASPNSMTTLLISLMTIT